MGDDSDETRDVPGTRTTPQLPRRVDLALSKVPVRVAVSPGYYFSLVQVATLGLHTPGECPLAVPRLKPRSSCGRWNLPVQYDTVYSESAIQAHCQYRAPVAAMRGSLSLNAIGLMVIKFDPEDLTKMSQCRLGDAVWAPVVHRIT